jgi:hypothetical protein
MMDIVSLNIDKRQIPGPDDSAAFGPAEHNSYQKPRRWH